MEIFDIGIYCILKIYKQLFSNVFFFFFLFTHLINYSTTTVYIVKNIFKVYGNFNYLINNNKK